MAHIHPENCLHPETHHCVALPRHDPLITGLADYYDATDTVVANCTTDQSSPPASITWYVNGQRDRSELSNLYHEEYVEENAMHLQMRTLTLILKLDPYVHFLGDVRTVELRCSAQVDGLPAVPQRQTTRIIRVREQDDRIVNQKQMTSWADYNSSLEYGLHRLLIWLPLSLLLLSAFRGTQLS